VINELSSDITIVALMLVLLLLRVAFESSRILRRLGARTP
jgi:hypothetical protein